MKIAISPRLRAPAMFIGVAAIAIVIGGISYGWSTVPQVVPILIVAAVALFLLARRDSDAGAITRHDADERQAQQRLQVQALVGRIMAIAVAVAYLAAVAAKATLWPFAILLGVLMAAFAAGWFTYGESGVSRRRTDDSRPIE